MALADAHGNPVTTSTREALAAAERALWRMMSFYGTPLDDLDAAIATDPGWRLPRLMKAGFLLGLTEPSLVAEARALLAATELLPGAADARERCHHAALLRLAEGDWAGAGAAWAEWLGGHPRDALALQWATLLAFHRGDAAMLHAHAALALPAWHGSDPLHPYVLGLHAFGLEETGRHGEAEAAGRQALDGPARVPWAIHAVAHVMEMQGRHAEGLGWMEQWRPHWGVPPDPSGSGSGSGSGERNGFAGHLGWHEALFALESLDIPAALRIFDAYLDAAQAEITLQRVDAASLLWRLELLGADVGGRWQALLAGWPLDEANAGASIFNDTHALLALLGAGERARARAWAAASAARAALQPGWHRSVSAQIGVPLMHGLLAFAEDRFTAAIAAIAPLRPVLAGLGGSHAQRDVFEQTLLAAALGAGDGRLARALLEARRRARRATPLAEHWTGRLGAPAALRSAAG